MAKNRSAYSVVFDRNIVSDLHAFIRGYGHGRFAFIEPEFAELDLIIPEPHYARTDIELWNNFAEADSQSILITMNENDYRPATALELLFLGLLHPDLTRRGPIVALATERIYAIADPIHLVPVMRRLEEKPSIQLCWFRQWDHGHFFACTQKKVGIIS